MRKLGVATAILVLFLTFSGTALAAGTVYDNPKIGIRFTMPDGWGDPEPDVAENFEACAKYDDGDELAYVGFSYVDLYGALTYAQQQQISRSEVNNSLYTVSDVESMFNGGSVTMATYNGVSYFKISPSQYDIGYASVEAVMLMHLRNGYQYMFFVAAQSVSRWMDEFLTMIKGVEYSADEAVSTATPTHTLYAPSTTKYTTSDPYSSTGLNAGTIFLSLIITIAVYSLPIIIYRYGIRKRPVSPKKAKTITIVWAIIGFFIMTFIVIALGGSGGATGGGIFLWSYVNYRMLKSGWEEEEEWEASREFITARDTQNHAQYQGYIQGGRYEGNGTLFSVHGEVIYSGPFSGGGIDETAEARYNRINSFKATCTAAPMQEIVRNAQLHTGLHVRLSGHVSSTLSGEYAGESLFQMYYENVRQSDAVIRVRYHLGKGESTVSAGNDVIVWGSVDEMVPSGMAGSDETLVPFVSAWYVEEASES